MDTRTTGGMCGSFTVCIDSYRSGVPVGRFYSECREPPCAFESVVQCLSQMEQIMDGEGTAGGAHPLFDRTGAAGAWCCPQERRGAQGTFLLRVLFRQNGSWQGSVLWMEGRQEQPFRSVLELILLMDSALQGHKRF